LREAKIGNLCFLNRAYLCYNNVPLETVSKLPGHSNIKIPQIYAKLLQQKVLNNLKDLEKELTKPMEK
jgi:hypothetical protein